MRLLLDLEPLLVQTKKVIHGPRRTKGDMSITQPQLLSGSLIGNVVEQNLRDDRHHAGAVCALLAVQQQRLLGRLKRLDEAAQLRRLRQSHGRELEDVERHAKFATC